MKKPLLSVFAIAFCVALFCFTTPLFAQDIDGADKNLIMSIMRGDLDAVEAAIREGADVNKKGKRGFTPYEAARRTGFKQIAELLVAKGAMTDVQVPTATEYVESILSEDFNDSSPACVVLVSQDGKIVDGFREKPLLEGQVSGGFFVFEPGIFDFLTPDCVLETPSQAALT